MTSAFSKSQGTDKNLYSLVTKMQKKSRGRRDGIEVSDIPPQDRQSEEISSFHNKIAQKAYELYEKRGCGDGRDLDDWLEAEKVLALEELSR